MREKTEAVYWYCYMCSIKHGKILRVYSDQFSDEPWAEENLLEFLKCIFGNRGHSKQTQFCLFADNYYKQAVRDNCFLVNKKPARTLIRSFMRACKKSVTVSITRDDGIRTMVTMTKDK